MARSDAIVSSLAVALAEAEKALADAAPPEAALVKSLRSALKAAKKQRKLRAPGAQDVKPKAKKPCQRITLTGPKVKALLQGLDETKVAVAGVAGLLIGMFIRLSWRLGGIQDSIDRL